MNIYEDFGLALRISILMQFGASKYVGTLGINSPKVKLYRVYIICYNVGCA